MKVLLGTFNKDDLPGAFFAIVELPTSARLLWSSNQHMCLVIYKLIDMFWCKHSLGTLQLLRHWGCIRDDQWSRFSAVKLPSHFLPLPHLHCTHWNIIKLLIVISRAAQTFHRFSIYLVLDSHIFICFPTSDAAAKLADRGPGAGCLPAAGRSRG